MAEIQGRNELDKSKTFIVMYKVPSTLIRFRLKTELFCSGCSYRPHYNAENNHRKRIHSKTLSRVEQFENNALWKRCFLVWMEKTMLSENGDVIKTDKTEVPDHSTVTIQNGGQTLPCGFQFCGPIYWNAHASSSFKHAHWGYKSFFKTDTAL